tara:strand:- start:1941 stop:2315 length:375 start_codon:yes stop_codon:yes gene_type:complete
MKLLTILTLAACFTILPSCSTAQEIWKKGDKVATFFVCKKEEDIMDVALADSKSVENFVEKIIEKGITKSCLSLRPPAMFIVDDIIGSYIDHKGEETSIIKIVSARNNLLTGYIVAAGIPDKGI